MIYVFSYFPFCNFIMVPLSCLPEIINSQQTEFSGLPFSAGVTSLSPRCPFLQQTITSVNPCSGHEAGLAWPSDPRWQRPCASQLLQPLPAMAGRACCPHRPRLRLCSAGTAQSGRHVRSDREPMGQAHTAGNSLHLLFLPQLCWSWPRQVEQILTSLSLSPSSGP